MCRSALQSFLHLSRTAIGQRDIWLQGEPRKVEAALLLPPFYFAKVTDAGLERWLRMILEVARMPVFLYNFPDHTGNFISPDLFVRLTRDFPLLRGASNCSAFRLALKSCPAGLYLLSLIW